jgi:hypothetical protein
MNHCYLAVAVLACSLALGACRGKESTVSGSAKSAATATAKEQTAGDPTLRFRIHPNLPEFAFTLVGDRSTETSETLHVKRIEIRRGAATEPFQVIEGLDTVTPLSTGTPGLAVLDMNFDGYGDIRLVEFQPAGPNVPYLNWLFDPTSGRFVENRALNAITSPQFDPVTREIRSNWRDGATRYGTDIYVFRDGAPVLVRKESKDYKGPGIYTLQVSQLVNGVWKRVEQREVREP